MPMDRTRYPRNWQEIAHSIKDRDRWTCQQCGLKHDEIIHRHKTKPEQWVQAGQGELPAEYERKKVKVVVSVHHIGAPKEDGTPGDCHDKMDCRDANLITLCARCHFLADLPSHIESAQRSRKNKKRARFEQRIAESGQSEFWEATR